jgi:hypothetical protein
MDGVGLVWGLIAEMGMLRGDGGVEGLDNRNQNKN